MNQRLRQCESVSAVGIGAMWIEARRVCEGLWPLARLLFEGLRVDGAASAQPTWVYRVMRMRRATWECWAAAVGGVIVLISFRSFPRDQRHAGGKRAQAIEDDRVAVSVKVLARYAPAGNEPAVTRREIVLRPFQPLVVVSAQPGASGTELVLMGLECQVQSQKQCPAVPPPLGHATLVRVGSTLRATVRGGYPPWRYNLYFWDGGDMRGRVEHVFRHQRSGVPTWEANPEWLKDKRGTWEVEIFDASGAWVSAAYRDELAKGGPAAATGASYTRRREAEGTGVVV